MHDVRHRFTRHTIVHVKTGMFPVEKVGDGASQVVLDQLEHQNEQPKDRLCYLTRTPDGKILKSSSLYIATAAAL